MLATARRKKTEIPANHLPGSAVSFNARQSTPNEAIMAALVTKQVLEQTTQQTLRLALRRQLVE
jgi:hypothetical protein